GLPAGDDQLDDEGRLEGVRGPVDPHRARDDVARRRRLDEDRRRQVLEGGAGQALPTEGDGPDGGKLGERVHDLRLSFERGRGGTRERRYAAWDGEIVKLLVGGQCGREPRRAFDLVRPGDQRVHRCGRDRRRLPPVARSRGDVAGAQGV